MFGDLRFARNINDTFNLSNVCRPAVRAKHRDRKSRKQKMQKRRSPNSDFF